MLTDLPKVTHNKWKRYNLTSETEPDSKTNALKHCILLFNITPCYCYGFTTGCIKRMTWMANRNVKVNYPRNAVSSVPFLFLTSEWTLLVSACSTATQIKHQVHPGSLLIHEGEWDPFNKASRAKWAPQGLASNISEALGQTDPSVLLRAQVWCVSTLNASSLPSRGNWHVLKGKQLGCNPQANQSCRGPSLCLAAFCMRCTRPSPHLSRQFKNPGEIKNFFCYTLQQNDATQLYAAITFRAAFWMHIPLI